MNDSVSVLLSTFAGRRFLPEQLASLTEQTHSKWRLFWRDDGPDDGSRALLADFASNVSPGRCVPLGDDRLHRGIAGSFLWLLGLHVGSGSDDLVAFADQDDIWLPEKLARGVGALLRVPANQPALYCARQMLVDAGGRTLGPSPAIRRVPTFPGALAQNIATGCTVMLNPAAARLIASLGAPPVTLHDWWCYLVVIASGGQILVDGIPVVLYRQHGRNAVGSAPTRLRRAAAALRRGPSEFMTLLRQHIAALTASGHALSKPSRDRLTQIDRSLRGSFPERFRLLRSLDFERQTWAETAIFDLWFLIG